MVEVVFLLDFNMILVRQVEALQGLRATNLTHWYWNAFQLAQTTMRSEIGKIPLDNVFKEREALNYSIVRSISKAAEPWGIVCLRYEIRK